MVLKGALGTKESEKIGTGSIYVRVCSEKNRELYYHEGVGKGPKGHHADSR